LLAALVAHGATAPPVDAGRNDVSKFCVASSAVANIPYGAALSSRARSVAKGYRNAARFAPPDVERALTKMASIFEAIAHTKGAAQEHLDIQDLPAFVMAAATWANYQQHVCTAPAS
jgi:hypothetical protein